MRQFEYYKILPRNVSFFYSVLSFFILTQAHSAPKELEECRIKATIAQDTNVIYDVDLTPQHEALVVGPEYYNLSHEQKIDMVQAYNCMMGAKRSNQNQECLNFSLKDYKTNKRVASFINCQLISE